MENGGDGSAYPKWFNTESLAEWHQLHLDEGWGESCTGSIVVEGNNLSCSKLMTKEGYYLELLLEGYFDDKKINEFCSKFFPDGLPEFNVKIVDDFYYGVFIGDRLLYKDFAYPEKKTNINGVKKLIKRLNGKKMSKVIKRDSVQKCYSCRKVLSPKYHSDLDNVKTSIQRISNNVYQEI